MHFKYFWRSFFRIKWKNKQIQARRQQPKRQVAKGNASSNLIGEVGRMSLEDREESSEDRDADTEGEGQSAEESEQEQDSMKIASDPADFTVRIMIKFLSNSSNLVSFLLLCFFFFFFKSRAISVLVSS